MRQTPRRPFPSGHKQVPLLMRMAKIPSLVLSCPSNFQRPSCLSKARLQAKKLSVGRNLITCLDALLLCSDSMPCCDPVLLQPQNILLLVIACSDLMWQDVGVPDQRIDVVYDFVTESWTALQSVEYWKALIRNRQAERLQSLIPCYWPCYQRPPKKRKVGKTWQEIPSLATCSFPCCIDLYKEFTTNCCCLICGRSITS